MIESLYLDNIKGILGNIELERVNIVIGRSNSGKSNLTEVLYLIKAIKYSKLEEFIKSRGGESKIITRNNRTNHIDIKTEKSRVILTGNSLKELGGGRGRVNINEGEWSEDPNFILYNLPKIILFNYNNRGLIRNINALRKDNFQYIRFTGLISTLYPDFKDFYYNNEGKIIGWINIETKRIEPLRIFSLRFIRVIGLIAFLVRLKEEDKTDITIVIDDIDEGLDPFGMSIIYSLLPKKSQIILTSNSTFLDKFKVKDLLITHNSRGNVTYKRVNENKFTYKERESIYELFSRGAFF